MLNKEFSVKTPGEIANDLENNSPHEILSFLESSTKGIAQDVFFKFSIHIIVDIYPLMNDSLFKKIFIEVDTHKAARVLSKLDRNSVNEKLELLPNTTSQEIKSFLIIARIVQVSLWKQI